MCELQKAEMFPKAEMYRRGIIYKDAKEKLASLLGGHGEVLFRNDNGGEVARLSKTSVGKLLSNAAVQKSINNGFTREQHYAVASDIDNLFKASFKLFEQPDNRGIPGVFIHRFAIPLNLDDAVAYITVKESMQHSGKRIYSIELIKIEKLGGMLEEARANPLTLHPAPSFHDGNIAKLKTAVKTGREIG
jgi:hypothetical protein